MATIEIVPQEHARRVLGSHVYRITIVIAKVIAIFSASDKAGNALLSYVLLLLGIIGAMD